MTNEARLRELISEWRKLAGDFDVTFGDSEVEGAYYHCAAELELATESQGAPVGPPNKCPDCGNVLEHKGGCMYLHRKAAQTAVVMEVVK